MRKLFDLIHGHSKAGKTWVGATGPTPRVYLDAEGRTEYAPLGRRIQWNPNEEPPIMDDWDTAVVRVKDWGTIGQVYMWLASQNHPFLSWTLDSMQESQRQLKREIVNGEDRNPTIPEWGILLRKVQTMLDMHRDMLRDGGQPLRVATVLCGSEDIGKGSDSHKAPMLDGAIQNHISYPFDLVGYLKAVPNSSGVSVPTLRIAPLEGFECGDGTDLLVRHYGPSIVKPNLTEMLSVLNEEV